MGADIRMPADGMGGEEEVSSQPVLNCTNTLLQGSRLHFLGEVQPP